MDWGLLGLPQCTYYTVMVKHKLSPVRMETDGLTQSDL